MTTLAEALRELLKYPFDTRGKWSPVWANAREALAAHEAHSKYVSGPITECEACLTPDACALRGQCAHYLREHDTQQQEPRRELSEAQQDALSEIHRLGDEARGAQQQEPAYVPPKKLGPKGSGVNADATRVALLRSKEKATVDLLQSMIVSAVQLVEGDAVTGYKIKTGALHKLVALHPALFFPNNLPSEAQQQEPTDAKDAARADTADAPLDIGHMGERSAWARGFNACLSEMEAKK
jgi:hypothetical protein